MQTGGFVSIIGRVRARGTLTLPAEIRERLGLAEGDQVEFEIDDDRLLVTPVRVVPRSQAWFWTPGWQDAEQEADDDIAAGRVERHESDEAFLAALDD
jgi:antitoxin MazE